MITVFVILLTFFVIGGGWSLCLLGQHPNWASLLVFSVLTGSAVIMLCWSWLFGLGGTVNHVEIGIAFIAFSGWLLAIFKQKLLRKSSSSPFQLIENKAFSLTVFLVLLIVSFVGLFPKMDSPLHLTMAIRTGPDAVGNSIAVDALLNDGSKFQIQKLLLSEVPALNSVEELLDSGELVYTFSSFSKQVKAEFIVFGLRLVLSGISASILYLIGEQHLWEVLAALPTLAVFCGVLLIFQCLKSNYVTTPFALAAALGGGVNVNLLHGWQEGGLAQSFVFLSTTAIFFGLFTRNLSRLQRFLFAALSSVVGLTVYSDWFIVFSCLLLVCFFLNLLFRQHQFLITRSGPVLVGFGFGFLLCGPFAIDFIRYVPRRINDAAAGGWPMPVWATPAEVFGIFHTYNTSLGTTGYRNGVIFLVFLLNLYLLAFLIRLVCTKFDPLTMTFLLSVIITILLVFVKVRFLDQSHNYQYFKAIGLLAPLFFPLVVFSLNSKSVNQSNRLRFYTLVFGTLVSSLNYTLNYRDSSLRLPYNSPTEVLASNSGGGLDQLNIVGKWNYEAMNLAPFIDLNFINRSDSIRFTRTMPLGLLINVRDCADWFCIQDVEGSKLFEVNSQFQILILSKTSVAVSSLNGKLLGNYSEVINELSNDLGGPSL
jgi:hypothetical protein